MEPTFWHQKWKTNDIGFHEPDPNALLLKHFPRLSLSEGSRIFLPLCGKTSAIHWLLSQGYCIAGAELSPLAAEQLFTDLNLIPTAETIGSLTRYHANNIDIFVGDIFTLTTTQLGTINAVYDRAALVALPSDLRTRYTSHITTLTHTAPQLLISFEYDQSQCNGPPFSVDTEEVERLYSKAYNTITRLENIRVPGGLKGECDALEVVWLLEE